MFPIRSSSLEPCQFSKRSMNIQPFLQCDCTTTERFVFTALPRKHWTILCCGAQAPPGHKGPLYPNSAKVLVWIHCHEGGVVRMPTGYVTQWYRSCFTKKTEQEWIISLRHQKQLSLDVDIVSKRAVSTMGQWVGMCLDTGNLRMFRKSRHNGTSL